MSKDTSKKLAVSVTAECDAAIRDYAHRKSCTLGEAVAALVKTAVGRRAAVSKYSREATAAARKARLQALIQERRIEREQAKADRLSRKQQVLA